jgi:hypothetical protein
MTKTVKILLVLGVAVGLGIAAMLLYLFEPEQNQFFGVCIFYKVTGLYCPGCGSTRAMHQLLHGHIVKAFGYNPLLVSLLPFLGYAVLSVVLNFVSGRRLPEFFFRPVIIWIVVGCIFAFWILRNIPIYPCTLLAP